MVTAKSWAMVKHIFTASTNPAVSLMLVTEPMDAVNIVTNIIQLLATEEIYEMVVTSKLSYGQSRKLSYGQTYIHCIQQPCCQLNASHRTNGCNKYSHNTMQLHVTQVIYEKVVTSKLSYGQSRKLSYGQTYIHCIQQPCCQLNASHRTNGCNKYSHNTMQLHVTQVIYEKVVTTRLSYGQS